MSVGRGWQPLVEELRRDLAAVGAELGVVYERYGLLAADISPWSAATQELVDAAEERSSAVCEECGRPGREVTLPSGWVKTRCGEHAAAERDDAYWAGLSRSVERGEYRVAGPVELGPAAPLRLSRITLYTPAAVLRHVAAAYAAILNAEPVTGADERGEFVEVTDSAGFVIELRPAEAGEVPTVTRLEFRGPGAKAAAERLHSETSGVQQHLYGGHWDAIAGNSVRLIGPGEDVSAEEKARISEAIQRGELEDEIQRKNEEKK
ncbi:hypothetical protein [Tsukamurella tyrosinosolvens]|uniref:hypothetical protein n=1 Tax=Tsukamurella tyrosinosolvens TaxID=57704 RepID=UPI000C7EA616|nr:hypothetical protein [Tsukamurella tyrosinosolvens]AUN38667.1 hypothetical protein ASU32_00460 [Tsukamurella tyrosinosolvens]